MKKRKHRRRSTLKKNVTGINKVIELTKGRPRKEEERFFFKFSSTQLYVIMLIIFIIPILFDGAVGYFSVKSDLQFIKPWLVLTIISLIFLVLSLAAITLGSVIFPLRIKREINLISFGTFMGGFFLFLVSLIVLLFAVT